MILIISNSIIEKQVIAFDRWHIYRYMEKNNLAVLVDLRFSNGQNSLLSVISEAEEKTGCKIDVVLIEEYIWFIKFGLRHNYSDIHKVKIPIASFLSDYFLSVNDLRRFIEWNNISILITLHDSSYELIRLIGTSKAFTIPYAVRPRLFYDGTHKDIPLSNVGGKSVHTPFRNKLIDCLKKNNTAGFYDLPHPGKRLNNQTNGLLDDYETIVKRSKISIATPTVFNISVRKYYEFMAAKVIPLGISTGYPEHEMLEKVLVSVSPRDSDREIVKKVEYALECYDSLSESLNSCYIYARENYTYEAIANRIYLSLINERFESNKKRKRSLYLEEHLALFKLYTQVILRKAIK